MPIEIDSLQGMPLFAGLSTTELEEIAAHLEPHAAAVGEELIREGEDVRQPLYVLLAGSVEVIKRGVDGRGHVIATLSAPSVFGEVEALVKRRAVATVRASAPVRVGRLRRGAFDEMCAAARPAALKIISNLAQVLSYRLAATDCQLAAQFELRAPGADASIGEVRRVLYTAWEPPA